MIKKTLNEKYFYQIDEHNIVHLFRGEEDCQQYLTNPLLSAIFKIEELENKIADIKANFDYILEGKNLEIKTLKDTDEYIIKTLERKVEKLQEDLRNKRISIKNKKVEIKTLGERCNQLLKDKGDLTDRVSNQAESLRITMLEEEKKGKRITELEKVNAELNKLRCCENCKNVNLQLYWRESKEADKMRQRVCGTCGNRKHWEYLGKTVGITETQQLTKAKELIKEMLNVLPKENIEGFYEITEEAEQFLKEIEK